ncbi:hypothetical protein ACTUHY_08270 [Acidaminococcus sp. LBK-2]|uniref:hypothetical protein n=1 Tax=Acidaminococcus sp. LBK-2 TaxID=3456956 RepID=UPI003FA43C7F
MDKERMEQSKVRLQEAVHWGRKQITPQRLKKGAGCLLALAVVAGGGKFALHRAKAEARSQEAQARTKMLQNLAAQKNLPLASIDAVKENIASILGTDVSNITFQSINLDDRKPGVGKPWDKKLEKKERKENRREIKADDSRKKPEKRPEGGQPGRLEEGKERADGRTGATPKQTEGSRTEMANPVAGNHFPGVYLARCEKGGMGYLFLVDAQSGQVIHGRVHKLNPIQQLLG